MECFCGCDYGDGEPVAVYNESRVVARKTHECCECGEDIRPGDRYELVKMCWGGGWGTFKTCPTCLNIRASLCGRCYVHGELRETIWRCMGLDYVTGELDDSEFWERAEEASELHT